MKTAIYKCVTPGCKATHRLQIGENVATAFCYEEKAHRTFKRVRGTTENSVHHIALRFGHKMTVDEHATEDDMRANLRHFFKNAPLRSRETITVYRGALIVRHTLTFSGCRPERFTVLYLYGKLGRKTYYDTYCTHTINDGLHSIAQAKRAVDRILKTNSL